MDRVISTNTVAFAGRDIAPASGTPGYFTSGNPATPTPATVFPGYWPNMIQDEIMAVISAAGITPDDSNWTQLLQALRALFGGIHQQIITASGSFTVPANIHLLKVTAIGGGGSGAGASATGAGQVSVGGGGNAGAIGVGLYTVTPGQVIPCTIGAGGVWSTVGVSGGATSFGTMLTAPGGISPGASPPANPPPLIQGSGAASLQASGGLINSYETSGDVAIATTTANMISGKGADCGGGLYGTGGPGRGPIASVGASGLGFGSGGGGASAIPSSLGAGAGAGRPGLIIVEF